MGKGKRRKVGGNEERINEEKWIHRRENRRNKERGGENKIKANNGNDRGKKGSKRENKRNEMQQKSTIEIAEYLNKNMKAKDGRLIARYRCGKEMRTEEFWREEEERRSRTCKKEEDFWQLLRKCRETRKELLSKMNRNIERNRTDKKRKNISRKRMKT